MTKKHEATPVIALLTEIAETKESAHFGSIHDFCIELAEYARQKKVEFYVSSLPFYTKNEPLGYTWTDGCWIKGSVPSAHVIYNRIHSRKTEQSPLFQALLQQLEASNTRIFNHQFLDKWEVYQLLSTHSYLLPYLPETQLFTSKQMLEQFLEQFETVFIKPIHGSQGRKIFRIQKEQNEFRLEYSIFTTETEQRYPSISSLFLALKKRIKQPVIIQRGLTLKTYKNRPIDFRLLCHRVNESKWQVTSSVARVAPEGNFVSNLARGGELFNINSILQEFGDEKTSFSQKKFLKELALEITTVLTSSAVGLYGEFGVDLALDCHGKPWVIEVNTKPSKNFDTPFSKKSIRPSAKALINYCIYLINNTKE